jgi:hypothetical protein
VERAVNPRHSPSWTALAVSFVALFGAFAFQALGGWWMIPSVVCLLVAMACVA